MTSNKTTKDYYKPQNQNNNQTITRLNSLINSRPFLSIQELKESPLYQEDLDLQTIDSLCKRYCD